MLGHINSTGVVTWERVDARAGIRKTKRGFTGPKQDHVGSDWGGLQQGRAQATRGLTLMTKLRNTGLGTSYTLAKWRD